MTITEAFRPVRTKVTDQGHARVSFLPRTATNMRRVRRLSRSPVNIQQQVQKNWVRIKVRTSPYPPAAGHSQSSTEYSVTHLSIVIVYYGNKLGIFSTISQDQ